MSDARIIAWIVGVFMAAMFIIASVIAVTEVTVTRIEADARVIVAKEVGSAISNFADVLKTGGKN